MASAICARSLTAPTLNLKYNEDMVKAEFTEMVASLTPAEQAMVQELVEYLRRPANAKSAFVTAAGDFIRQHPELLKRLAQ